MGSDQDNIIVTPWTTLKYRVTGSTASVANSSATAASTATTILPSQVYPTTSLNLYPVPSSVQQTDTPQPVRFANINEIIAAARSAPDVPAAIDEITTLLRERHRLGPEIPDDFIIRDLTEITKTMSSTTDLMTKLLLIVATISLVVGGVGISEYHAGVRDGENARDRPENGRRRASVGYSAAIPDRSRCSMPDRRDGRDSFGTGNVVDRQTDAALAHGHFDESDRRGGRCIGDGRRGLRLLSRLESIAVGPH